MTFTLSGGEAQRINLAAALSSSLVGTLFVLDEPSVGLHPRDNHRLIQILRSLKDIGNTVVVVEHDPEIIRAAEHVVDLGPRAGEAGGEIVFAGPMDAFLESRTSLTAQYMRGEKSIPVPGPGGSPAGTSRSGTPTSTTSTTSTSASRSTSSLRHRSLGVGQEHARRRRPLPGAAKARRRTDSARSGARSEVGKVVLVDQSPLSVSPRSIPATYTKAMDGIRDLFSQTREARIMGMKPGYLLLQHGRRPLRGMPGGRPADRRDAVPLGRRPDLRSLQGEAVQERGPRGPLRTAGTSTRSSG